MMDYLEHVSGASFSDLPWQPLDSMIMANMCYNKLGVHAATHAGMPLSELAQRVDLSPYVRLPYYAERKALLMAMGASRRFGGALACCYLDILDDRKPLQFSAVTLLIPGAGVVICYRGTDNTLVGWREDLHMSFETVPAQEAALVYLNEIARRYPGPLILTGHSKGGNLAAYAAAHAELGVQARIERIDCFDSPGLDDDTLHSDGYAAVRSLISCYVPQDSVIGLLMDTDSRTRMVVVKSTANGLRQHDCFSWQVENDQMVTLPGTTFGSKLADRALDTWMERCTPEQRRTCVDALFDVLDATQSETLTDMKADMGRSLLRMIAAARTLDSETMLTFLQMAGLLIQSSATTAADMVFTEQLGGLFRQLTSKPAENGKPAETAAGPLDQLGSMLRQLGGKSAEAPSGTERQPAPEAPGLGEQLLQGLGAISQAVRKGIQSLDDKLEHNRDEHPGEGGLPL